MPPPGTTDSGSDDPPSESSDTATSDPKSYLVMSGGEGYIDFRLGEWKTPLSYRDRWVTQVERCAKITQRFILTIVSTIWKQAFTEVRLVLCLNHHLLCQVMKAVSWMVHRSQQQTSRQCLPKPSGATSLSGRSQPLTTENLRAAHQHLHGPIIFIFVFLTALKAWVVNHFV